MKLIVDTDTQELIYEINGDRKIIPLYTNEAFELLSKQWLSLGWNQKYSYSFSWLGRPIIQLPEDLIRIQEVIYQVKPDVIIETGIAHGGSLIYYASLFQAMGKGRVIGVDIEIRPHNRQAIESHELFPLITLIEGSSIAPEILSQVKSLVKPGENIMAVLDSNHTKQHVLAELESYSDLVTPGSYIVATDGVMKDLDNVPRGKPEWKLDNPAEAAIEFVAQHPEFVIEQPKWPFNESTLTQNITHWPSAWLRRK
ncbi:MAG: cephalosporin hydroxylase family protein [Trichodesmium sp. MAG_R03]|nr:cephalosporin hydroxylase family protein [Trichodesmium sp. MAG_R03]